MMKKTLKLNPSRLSLQAGVLLIIFYLLIRPFEEKIK
jgi:hypothetical protein